MDTEPEIVTFIVRLAAGSDDRLAGVIERVRSGERRRFQDIEAIGPLITAMLRGGVEDGEAPAAGGRHGMRTRGATVRGPRERDSQ
jgi:hypothetical protein